jgi:hypothetical protein
VIFTAKVRAHEIGLEIEAPVMSWPTAVTLLEKSAQKHNGYMTVTLSLPHRPRSTGWKSQNHHLWGHAAQIGQELGYDRREMLYLIAEMTSGWPMAEYKGKMVPVSEAKISSEVASEAIETAHRIAAENGIRLVEDGAQESVHGREGA